MSVRNGYDRRRGEKARHRRRAPAASRSNNFCVLCFLLVFKRFFFLSWTNLLIIFSINQFVVWSIKCQIMVKIVELLHPQMFRIVQDTNSFSTKKPEFRLFFLRMTQNSESVLIIVGDSFSSWQLLDYPTLHHMFSVSLSSKGVFHVDGFFTFTLQFARD